MKVSKLLLLLLQIYLVINITPIFSAPITSGFDEHRRGSNYNIFFSPMMDRYKGEGNMIKNYYKNTESTYAAINQGFAIANLMRFYDMYGTEEFISDAKEISDAIGTYLIDLRYDLVASYYSTETYAMSNYRYFTDNLLISWGLNQLATNLNANDRIANQTQYDRLSYIDRGLHLFDTDTGFREFIRVDQDIPTSTIIKSYPALFASYLILINKQFSTFKTSLLHQYEFIRENMTAKGGVFTIYNNGYTDDIVTVTNTMLFVNVALLLYKETGDTQYLTDAETSFNYVQTYAKDISITLGYIESLKNDAPLQQSKSLFSHALVLLALLEFASLGYDVQIDLLITWQTIMQYFRTAAGLFYSTINRRGSSSGSIKTFDNMMMLTALAQMPNLVMVDYYSTVQFSDKFHINVTAFIPKNYKSTIEVYFNSEVVLEKEIMGTGKVTSYQIELVTPRPNDSDEFYTMFVNLKSENITTDQVQGTVKVTNRTGVNLSVQAISLLSIVLIVIFVLFINKVNSADKVKRLQKLVKAER